MKIIITAMALAIAFPAAAQTAPAPQPHQDHGQMQMPMNPADHAQHQAPQGHAAHDGCCQDRNGNGVMDCCEHMAQATEPCDDCPEGGAASPAQHQDHQNH